MNSDNMVILGIILLFFSCFSLLGYLTYDKHVCRIEMAKSNRSIMEISEICK